MIRITALVAIAGIVHAAGAKDFPPFDTVSEGYEKVVSTAGDEKPLITIWKREKDAQLLAEIPRSLMNPNKTFYIIPTVAGGDTQMGVYSIWHYLVGQEGTHYYAKQFDDKLAFIEPNLAVRTKGDNESKLATERVYTDRVVLSTPILCKGPGGGWVIDLDQVLLRQSGTFFGPFTRGADYSLASIESVKTFPYNSEISLTVPRAGGRLATIHYSIGSAPKSQGFKPREADRRVGFFYTNFTDRSRNDGESQTTRYAHRWHLEKRDPNLKLSPPKKPIVYYIEHTTPVRYRRWVREGLLAWNEAFEQVGILNAIEVRQQDEVTGAYMDLDPEDIRYSFIRWTNSHMGFAIGPSHAHPDTGEIYEADIVLDEGFISGWADQYVIAELASAAMSTFDEETVAWLDEHDDWDPRVRLTPAAERQEVIDYKAAMRQGRADPDTMPPTMLPRVWQPTDPDIAARGGICTCMSHMAASVAMTRLALDAGVISAGEDDSLLDTMPESFVGPLLRWVTMHEVGHTLGLMHNWKGSSRYTYEEINSGELEGPWSVSVMDYPVVNIVVSEDESELVQGDYAISDIGTYDRWAIKWGYTSEDPGEIARQAADPDHAFTSDEGSSGPDPHAKTWDLSANSIDFADAQIRLVNQIRGRILEDIVDDNESWEKARRTYVSTIYAQLRAIGNASGWIGGAHVNRSFKGDEGATVPVTPVDVEQQRRAIAFIIDNAFADEAWGLDADLLARMTADQWFDGRGGGAPDWPIHDQILGVQASAMTTLLSPTRLRRIIDNEMRTPAGEDALTVPELMEAITDSVWADVNASPGGRFDARRPMISSLRRNLQREHLDRLIDLATGMRWPNASANTVATLAREQLRQIAEQIDDVPARSMDAYTRAHLADARERIDRALDAAYTRND